MKLTIRPPPPTEIISSPLRNEERGPLELHRWDENRKSNIFTQKKTAGVLMMMIQHGCRDGDLSTCQKRNIPLDDKAVVVRNRRNGTYETHVFSGVSGGRKVCDRNQNNCDVGEKRQRTNAHEGDAKRSFRSRSGQFYCRYRMYFNTWHVLK